MFQLLRMEVIMTNEEKILEGQLRECYGRVVYTHKTHEKPADALIKKKFLYKMGTDYSFSNYCWWSNYHAF